MTRTVVAGFGNVLLGDDGFGVEVIRRLGACALPDGTSVLDVGIGGMELIFSLMSGCDRLIVVDAARRGVAPGTLSLFSPSAADLAPRESEGTDPHLTEPSRALRMAGQLGALPKDILVVTCEIASCDLEMALSPAVEAAVPRAVEMILAHSEARDGARAAR